MARTSRNGAPAPSFDNLDDLDIDDMFGADDDGMFDEIGMDLAPIGQLGADLTDNFGAVPEMEEAAPFPVPSPSPAAVEEAPKRRKTKRKPKSPILLDEDEDLNEAPKKKRKSNKLGNIKKKGSKKDKDNKEESKGSNEVSTKSSKSKVKGMGMTPSLTRGASSGPSTPQGQVAAAGMFGVRQKRGHTALPLSRAISDKHKLKTKSSSKSIGSEALGAGGGEKIKTKKGTSSSAAAPAAAAAPPQPVVPEVPKGPPVFAPPIPQSSYCGLKPSSTLFYPFLPTLPNEPSIKNRKQYPVLDRINTVFMGFINATSATKNAAGGAPVNDTEEAFRLMLDTLKDLNPSGGQPTEKDDKKTAISNAIGSLRQTVTGMDKHTLAMDLFSTCSLLKRQHDFLQLNLSNMDRWCKENFSEADYDATYGDPEKKEKEVVVESLLKTFKKPLIKVKIKCSGFKEPKLSGPLFAFLPASIVPPGPGDISKEKKTTKKRKSAALSSSEPSLLPPTIPVVAAPVVEKEVVIKTYAEQRPKQRRQLITDHIAHTAKELEAACIISTVARCQAIDRRHTDLKKMVDEDEVLVIHTAAMWQYIDKAGYFSDFTEEALNDTLRSVWAPEVKSNAGRDIPFDVPRAAARIQNGNDTNSSDEEQLLFDRLQSLLVDEQADSDDELDDDDEDEDESFLHDNFDESIEVLSLPPRFIGPAFADLASLNLHERAYLHLRRSGLCEHQAYPILKSNAGREAQDQALPVTSNSNLENQALPVQSNSSDISEMVASERDTSWGRETTVAAEEGISEESSAEKETLEDIVKRMSADLRDLNKINNSRASFLENVARTRLATTRDAKKKAGEEMALIAKCHQLLKRSKDHKAKPSKPKVATKDEYALPW